MMVLRSRRFLQVSFAEFGKSYPILADKAEGSQSCMCICLSCAFCELTCIISVEAQSTAGRLSPSIGGLGLGVSQPASNRVSSLLLDLRDRLGPVGTTPLVLAQHLSLIPLVFQTTLFEAHGSHQLWRMALAGSFFPASRLSRCSSCIRPRNDLWLMVCRPGCWDDLVAVSRADTHALR
jgi:hypothetical protein